MTNTDVPCVARPARTFVFQNSNGEECEYVRADIADDLIAALETALSVLDDMRIAGRPRPSFINIDGARVIAEAAIRRARGEELRGVGKATIQLLHYTQNVLRILEGTNTRLFDSYDATQLREAMAALGQPYISTKVELDLERARLATELRKQFEEDH